MFPRRSSTRVRILTLTTMAAILASLNGQPAALAREKVQDKIAWAQWRGPSGQGYSTDTRVPLVWSETQNVLWKTELPGHGNSSPIVWADRIFLTASSQDGKERYVFCVSATDGKILWQKLAAKVAHPGKSHQWNRYASASCTTDGTHVYAFFGTPGLFCYDFDGKLIWQHQFGAFTSKAGWGTAASPFLFDDLVIQNCDNDGSAGKTSEVSYNSEVGDKPEGTAPMALIALDKRTGEQRWLTQRNQGRGFSTPVIIPTPEGRIDLVLNGPHGVWAYDPRTGKEIWHCERTGEGEGDQNSARFGEPIPVHDPSGTIYAPSGRPGPFQAIRMGGAGNITESHRVWQVIRKGHRDVASPILWGDLIFIADSKGMMTCYEAKSGKVVWDQRIGAKMLASPVAVRGKLLFTQDDGTTLVVEPGREFKLAGKNKLGDGGQLEFGASPAIVGGRIYLRSQSHLYCIGEKP